MLTTKSTEFKKGKKNATITRNWTKTLALMFLWKFPKKKKINKKVTFILNKSKFSGKYCSLFV